MLNDAEAVATIPVKSAAKARDFYRDKLGLETVDDRPGVATYRSGESKVFVYESEYAGTNEATAATWMIDDVDGVVRDLKSRGVAFEHYPDLPGLKIEGDVHVADGGAMKVAWFKDPDGNILSIVSGGE
ncbi:MAG TPA: VOC family protein [Caulobacteraceae bacterium]|jgi:catechol 2,3-dioxygenase-like lactoylglutathione lyase family enzyme|nr:VOC family protein [Caulobacteraceae bacterium]